MKEPGGITSTLFREEERAAIFFAERLTTHPGSISQADLDELGKFFNQEQIVELTLTIATANLTNRFNEGVKTPLDV